MILFRESETLIDYQCIRSNKIFNKVKNSCKKFIGNKNFYISYNTMKNNPIGDFDMIVRFILAVISVTGQSLDPKLVKAVQDELEYCIYHRNMSLTEFCSMILVSRYIHVI